MVTRTQDDWYLLSGGKAEPIVSLQVLINDGFTTRVEYDYLIEPDHDGLMCSVIIQDRARIIVKDCNGVYAFGLAETPPCKSMLMYARTEKHLTVILATDQGCHVEVLPVEPFSAYLSFNKES